MRPWGGRRRRGGGGAPAPRFGRWDAALIPATRVRHSTSDYCLLISAGKTAVAGGRPVSSQDGCCSATLAHLAQEAAGRPVVTSQRVTDSGVSPGAPMGSSAAAGEAGVITLLLCPGYTLGPAPPIPEQRHWRPPAAVSPADWPRRRRHLDDCWIQASHQPYRRHRPSRETGTHPSTRPSPGHHPASHLTITQTLTCVNIVIIT